MPHKDVYIVTFLGETDEYMYSKTCLKRPLKKNTKIGFQYRYSLDAGQRYCRMLQGEHSAYFRPPISYHLSLGPLFLSFFEWPLKTGLTIYYVLFYMYIK